jgi:asparagine synthase (glutamine-hydrolysing)
MAAHMVSSNGEFVLAFYQWQDSGTLDIDRKFSFARKGRIYMCGIAGILNAGSTDLAPLLEAMAVSLRHRGPDASGTWTDTSVGVGLAHRRLSILDLSVLGNQPMVSESGRFVISYNGEVYNHQELRKELEKIRIIPWHGRSDTEVLLNAIEQWGVRISLERINGMFAFAVWDRQERKLTLARDRMGEKPLYVGRVDASIVFASELKAFRRLPQWKHSVNRQALGLLLRFGYIPAPLSIYEGIFKLPAASFVKFGIEQSSIPLSLQEFASRVHTYWSLPRVAIEGLTHPFLGDEVEAIDALQTLLDEAVRLRMEADVPVGVLLSGGLDSSLISALMQSQSPRPVRTFTIGFREDRFDEARYAQRIADHIGSKHTEFRLSPEHAMDIIPRLPEVYDEPFADSSQIPTVIVSAIARQHVTVALSGDGGDELFFGYGRYFDANRIWQRVGNWPASTRRRFAAIIESASHIAGGLGRLGFRMRRLQQRIKAECFDDFYGNLLSLSLTPTAAICWPQGFVGTSVFPAIPHQLENLSMRMMFADQSLYLPEDILTKVDRASMAVGLELRAPLLDHRIVEFSWRLPERLRFNGRNGKVLLRKLLYRHIPQELVDRPKHGFDIPVDAWLRRPLRTWMLDLLNPDEIKREGYLDPQAVAAIVNEHLSGYSDHGYALWTLLIFQAWLRCKG